MTTKRKVFSNEFKAKVALEAIRGIRTVNEIAQEAGVHPTQVSQWKKELQEHASSVFHTKRGPQTADAASDAERLYSEIGRLKMELDWLKKSQGYAYERTQAMGQHDRFSGVDSTMRISRCDPLHCLCNTSC